MSVLQEVLMWSKSLPAWQGDCVRRLLRQDSLTPQDFEDVLALLKAAHGITDPQGRIASPLNEDQIPAAIKPTTHIELLAVKNLVNVNAIAPEHSLAFAPQGLTVIYGGNGSGKSGYSRVLKRACRARDQSETIYPNANHPLPVDANARASFSISVNGVGIDVLWTDNQPAPPELSSLSIFDSRCANAYLVNEADYSYVPHGLDVFERLAVLQQQLKTAIEQEQKEYSVDLTAFSPMQGKTEVGRMIAALSAKTNPDTVQTLGTLSEDELTQHTTIGKSLQENNPKEKANQLRRLAQRISVVAGTALNKSPQVDQDVEQGLKQSVKDYLLAKSAAELAANKFKEQQNLLPGTGGDAWRELFDAARKFALESHPGQDFISLDPNSPCPLCQQTLNDGAARLARFEEFIQQEAEKTSRSRRKAMVEKYTPLTTLDVTIGLDEATHAEIHVLAPKIAADCREYERALGERRDQLVDAVKSNNWTGITPPPSNPSSGLQALVNQLNQQALNLEQASDEVARIQLQQTYAELEARVLLSKVKDAVINAISRMTHVALLAKCITSLRTNAISTKATQIGETVISTSLQDALNAEFKALGVGGLQVALHSRSGRGKMLHKLKLDLPQSRNPKDLLSEGEQRAIALASFLAEVGLDESTGGIILDDPVSSLDHRRRERVAARLVKEAARRQVVVFTHDIYFLCVLAEQADSTGVTAMTQSIAQSAEGYGVATPELPFEGKNTTGRIGSLMVRQQHITKLFRSGEEDEHRRQTVEAYFLLRMAWERAVEEVLLRCVVLRFRKGVETQRLSGVIVDDNDYLQVTAGMSKCSNYAHDKAMAGDIAVPDPDELLTDIQALEAWRLQIETRSTATSRARKSGTFSAPLPITAPSKGRN
ncbi:MULTISPECIES: AAA family ATPase [unclassified Pseudomonas]|uniref:AAA family ATPase n=1 Tax=unclassified Pseudomonas TaxID=196821 RepID=UPI002A37017E|nr:MULTISPECIES: AAA family ATPase [unclassified Pseudomonas]MDX9669593.1 AAA family ATPase [Pseudomonas sp. P8_250]WPN36373.1 AAA family ATPase [Pseudomonas sp. P8_139]WPN41826.1 AAA family ATPase [Pseudomonas sp. P8_229]